MKFSGITKLTQRVPNLTTGKGASKIDTETGAHIARSLNRLRPDLGLKVSVDRKGVIVAGNDGRSFKVEDGMFPNQATTRILDVLG